MPEEDFDIDALAAYLHLAPAQVAKMADRGQIPGRRVGGAWRFAHAEIHHWLEERIGAFDDAELARLEGRLEQSRHAEPGAIVLAQLLPLEAIAVPLPARTRSSVISSMCELAARTGWLWDPEQMAEAVRHREDMYPTALDNGVALLHPRRPMPGILAQPFLAFGRTDRGIPFAGRRGILTDCFFLILSVNDTGHLRTLARLSRLLGLPGFLDELRAAPDAHAVHELIAQRETTLAE
jgi:PTS system nitrogen regulatory IIA component